MSDPEYIYNFDTFDTADEAVEEYRNYFACPHKSKPLRFLDWFCTKITKPNTDEDISQMIWKEAKIKHNQLRTLQNRDAFMWKDNVTGIDILNAWLKWEVNNPKTGKSIADKRWILDWLFAPLDKEFDESINGKTYDLKNKKEE